ncbi:MAG: cytochrome d ubiquinol oxidase subunit II [Acidobacteria bacterium]|nr:cytochrome d ubiquinol oxidase subunit II [Acidobacteriota bacterium]
MLTAWFMIVALMIAAYVILDGFDLGAGIVHHFVARTDEERESVIAAVGPVWDGNEVWLLAAGGTLYFAFPVLYSAGFSGFYLPLIIVLWLLIGRAAGIELRHQIEDPMWHKLWDFIFSLSSILLAVFYGAALGNVIRGVPLNSEGYFFEPLWTTFRVTKDTGILDWFTVLAGLVALVALGIHGAAWLAIKTTGEVQARSRRAAGVLWYALLVLTILSLIGVINLREGILDNFSRYPIGWLVPVTVIASLACVKFFNAKGKDTAAFVSSALYLASMLAGAVFALYPNVLPANDPANSLTIENASAGAYGLSVGLIWWPIAVLMALGYFFYLFRTFSGKVAQTTERDPG